MTCIRQILSYCWHSCLSFSGLGSIICGLWIIDGVKDAPQWMGYTLISVGCITFFGINLIIPLHFIINKWWRKVYNFIIGYNVSLEERVRQVEYPNVENDNAK